MLAQQSAIIVKLIKVFLGSLPELRYHLSLGMHRKPREPTSSAIDSARVLHNLRPCAKNGDFCSQLGSKAQFIQ